MSLWPSCHHSSHAIHSGSIQRNAAIPFKSHGLNPVPSHNGIRGHLNPPRRNTTSRPHALPQTPARPSAIPKAGQGITRFFAREKRRQDRRRSARYPLTSENTNNTNTAKVRSITITELPSKHLLTLQPRCQPRASSFQRLTAPRAPSSVESDAHICHPIPTLAISSYNLLPITRLPLSHR